MNSNIEVMEMLKSIGMLSQDQIDSAYQSTLKLTTPIFHMYATRRENKQDTVLRLFNKFSGHVSSKAVKALPSLQAATAGIGHIDLISDTYQSMIDVYTETIYSAIQVKPSATVNNINGETMRVVKLLTAAPDRQEPAQLLVALAIEIGAHEDYVKAINTTKPDLDMVNVGIMLVELVYRVSSSALLALLAIKLTHLDAHVHKIFDMSTVPLTFDHQWEKDVVTGNWVLSDPVGLALSVLHGANTEKQINNPETVALLHTMQHNVFIATVQGTEPVYLMYVDHIRNADKFVAGVKSLKHKKELIQMDSFLERQTEKFEKSSLLPKVFPTIQSLGLKMREALQLDSTCSLQAFKTRLNTTTNLGAEAIRLEEELKQATANLDFSTVSEKALELEVLKEEVFKQLNELKEFRLIESVVKAPEVPVSLVTEQSTSDADLQALYDDEINGLKAQLKDAEHRETLLRDKFDSLYQQMQTTNKASVDHTCFTPQAIRFMNGEGKLSEIVDVINSMRPDIVFCEGVRESLECSSYNQPHKLLKSLMLLADYHRAIVAGQADASAMDILGSIYSANESEAVMNSKPLAAMRQFKLPNGESVEMQQHLSIGSRTGEAYTIQAHFRIIDEVLYIGRIGGHLTTSTKH
jgi:hypothetical protein